MGNFECPRGHNKDEKYIGEINGKKYCRKCISFSGEHAKGFIYSKGEAKLFLSYPLSKEQQHISDRVIFNFKKGYNTLINAVCGAGKTELVFGVIEYALKRELSVGFALPRRDVASELFIRIKEAFKNNTVTLVIGGLTDKLNADIVVLTTHQLYRYPCYFDLLILDEIDAFPFRDNELLNTFFYQSVKGNFILMSATVTEENIKQFSTGNNEILYLNTRFHRKPLPVPEIKIRYSVAKIIFIIKKLKQYKKEKKPVLIFAPTIDIANKLYRIISIFLKNGNIVSSKAVKRSEIIEHFRNKQYDYLVTTAVLERGVTIANLQVIIFKADHDLYDEGSLIQISGRVGRKFYAPDGEVIFLASKITGAMENAIKTIKEKNKDLQNLF